MKRLCLLFVVISALLLSGCSRTADAKRELEAFSNALAEAESIYAEANVRAEYEHKTVRFALQYTEDESGGVVTVVAPELISGISARVQKDSTRIEFGELSLETGALDRHGLSPMSAMPILMRSLRHGHLDSVRTEGEYRVMQLVPDDEYICSVWFDAGMKPCRAEIQSDGRVVIYIDITRWDCG